MKWTLFLTASLRFHPLVHCFSTLAATSTKTATTFVRWPSILASSNSNSRHILLGGTLRGGGSLTNTYTTRATTTTTTTALGKSAVSTEEEAATTSTEATKQDSSKAMMMMTPSEKLEALRSKMKELGLDVYLVPSGDPHLSEYTPEAYKRRQFISGFSGSAGTAVVTQEDARLWTDSRYFNEANLQLDAKCWTLMKGGQPNVDTIPKHLAKLATAKYTDSQQPLIVGLDPFVHPASYPKELKEAFAEAATDEFGSTADETVEIAHIETSHDNLIDPIWGDDRPDIPTSAFQIHPLEYAGKTYQDKVAKIRTEMETKKASLAVFCTLDDVAYLLNVRSQGDIDTCPV